MRVIARRTLREFWEQHASSEQALKSWYHEAAKAKWASFQAIKRNYPSASILHGGRVCFNTKGNKFRLIARVNVDAQVVFIRFVGTHAEYDKIDANTI